MCHPSSAKQSPCICKWYKYYLYTVRLKGPSISMVKIVSETENLISVIIRIVLISGYSKLNFSDPNMINIIIRHIIYCLYPNPIREFSLRKKNYLQYPFVSDSFSSLSLCGFMKSHLSTKVTLSGLIYYAHMCRIIKELEL